MQALRRKCRVVLIGFWISAFIWSHGVATAQEQQVNASGFWDTTKNNVQKIAQDGKWDVYVSGYGKHFAEPHDGRLNERIWGGGFGKTLRNAKGNDESLFIMITQDSNWNKQYVAGYSHQWIASVGNGIELGGGYTAFVIRRMDVASGTPFPFVLPIASIGTKKAKLMTTLAPYNGGKSQSAVLYLFGKYTFD